MGRFLKLIITYRQSFLIIVVLISTLTACFFSFREKVNEIVLSEIRSTVLARSQDELILINQKFKSVLDVLTVAEQSISKDEYLGIANATGVLDSVSNVTGFFYFGIADIDGNNVFGYPLEDGEYEKIVPTFHGRPTITYFKNGTGYEIVFAVPLTKFATMKYVLYARVTDEELIGYLNHGRLLMDKNYPLMSYLVYDLKEIVHVNDSSTNSVLPTFTTDVLQRHYKEYDNERLKYKITQNPQEIYTFNVDNYSPYYMVIMPSIYSSINFVTLMPAKIINARVNAIMALFTILSAGIIWVVIFLLTYYEFVVNMNRKSIYKLAYIDDFTGLPNKTSLRVEFNNILARSTANNKLFICKFIIQNRDQISRLYGHDVAKKFDLEVARYIKEHPIQNFYTARVHETFIALMLVPSLDYAQKIIMKAFSSMDRVAQIAQPAIFNCGLYEYNSADCVNLSGDVLDTLVDNCNIAISMAPKNIKEHTVNVFDKEIRDEMIRRDTIEKDLLPGLRNGEFLVYLQPKYDLKTNKLAGAEALIRWNYKGKGIIPPFKFIPVFEKNGSIALIDNFVLNDVLKYLRKWNKLGYRLVPISVNLSQVQFLNPNLIGDFKKRVNKYQDLLKFIDVEITESSTIEDFNHVVQVLNQLKSIGVKLSMDDFGTGYSSLSNLSLLPFDTIKLDKSFVDKIDKDHQAPSVLLIKDIISIIRHFRMTSLVEGVETIDQRDLLRDLGCQYCQGYYYSKPLPVEEFETLLKEDKVFDDVIKEQMVKKALEEKLKKEALANNQDNKNNQNSTSAKKQEKPTQDKKEEKTNQEKKDNSTLDKNSKLTKEKNNDKSTLDKNVEQKDSKLKEEKQDKKELNSKEDNKIDDKSKVEKEAKDNDLKNQNNDDKKNLSNKESKDTKKDLKEDCEKSQEKGVFSITNESKLSEQYVVPKQNLILTSSVKSEETESQEIEINKDGKILEEDKILNVQSLNQNIKEVDLKKIRGDSVVNVTYQEDIHQKVSYTMKPNNNHKSTKD